MKGLAAAGAVLVGNVAAGVAALTFCGCRFRRTAAVSILLAFCCTGSFLFLSVLSAQAWIQALTLAGTAGLVLGLFQGRQWSWRTVPCLAAFCACGILYPAAAEWLATLVAVPVLWLVGAALILLTGGTQLLRKIFPPALWEELWDGQMDTEHFSQTMLTMSGLLLDPAALALIAWISPSAGTLLGAACALALALLGCRLLLRVEEMARELNLRHQSQRELHQFMSIIRSQRHDYNLHMHTVVGLIRRQQYDQCQKYIDTVVADSQDVNIMLHIHEPVIGALLSGYRDLAREQGCEMEFRIADNLSQLVSTPYDTNRILGNLLQNALDEASKAAVRDKRIILTTLRRGGNTVIRVSNAVQDPGSLEQVFAYGVTGKGGHEGIGLNSVARLLELCHGMIYYELEGARVAFVVRIPNRM